MKTHTYSQMFTMPCHFTGLLVVITVLNCLVKWLCIVNLNLNLLFWFNICFSYIVANIWKTFMRCRYQISDRETSQTRIFSFIKCNSVLNNIVTSSKPSYSFECMYNQDTILLNLEYSMMVATTYLCRKNFLKRSKQLIF